MKAGWHTHTCAASGQVRDVLSFCYTLPFTNPPTPPPPPLPAGVPSAPCVNHNAHVAIN
ncbi:hypothetical protein E2C01_099102 [Portunus trituberculatus]|uniref:Uncharacterized protein n=1 Tax=Portunus trituberculatus TaxID=210409 RepID=A0A5B7JZF3_PORTR|nr:hypothetical protein [Portunus trituberculatus]